MHKEEILMKVNILSLIKDDELLEKHNKTWHKVRNSIKELFDSESVYNQSYLK